MNIRTLGFAVLATGLVAAAHAQQMPVNLAIGGSYGVLYLQDDAMKTAFGSSIVRVGLTPVSMEQRQKGIVPGWEIISANANGNNMFLLPVTWGWQQNLSEEGMFRPYFRVFAGVAYMDYGVTVGATRYSSRTFGTTWGAEVGTTLTDRIRVYLRYNAFTKQDGLSFNNLELVGTYTLFKL